MSKELTGAGQETGRPALGKTPTTKITWSEAIQLVLEKADEELHYTEIAKIILSKGMVKSAGATPAQTVAAHLSTSIKNDPESSPFQRVSKGRYILRKGILPEKAQDELQEEIAEAAAEDVVTEAGALQAFGMYWRREAVMWSKTSPPIFGHQSVGAKRVDFGGQVGVYLLHDRDRVIYVGRASDTLATRLRAHTTDRLGGRWDRFSWFGLRAVQENGTLSGKDFTPPWSHSVVIETMEALLIESLEPPLNRKRGDNFSAAEYLQVEDPEMEKSRQKKLLEAMKDKLLN